MNPGDQSMPMSGLHTHPAVQGVDRLTTGWTHVGNPEIQLLIALNGCAPLLSPWAQQPHIHLPSNCPGDSFHVLNLRFLLHS